MAVLDPNQLGELRSRMARNTASQTWSKSQFNAAIQAIEDLMFAGSTRTTVSNAIEGAAAGVFNTQQKELLFAIWSLTYAQRQGVI
jgi:hypothetical protein